MTEVEILEPDEEVFEDDSSGHSIEFFQEYPNIGHIKSLKMKKASISKRYGDPNNENVRKWYLEDGNTYPYPKWIQESSIMKRKSEVEAGSASRET